MVDGLKVKFLKLTLIRNIFKIGDMIYKEKQCVGRWQEMGLHLVL